MKNKKVFFQDWGLVDYQQAWDRQEDLFSTTVKTKLENRNNELAYAEAEKNTNSDVIFEPFEAERNFQLPGFLRTPSCIYLRQKRQSRTFTVG
jgi:lipoyl(octanoyl) transferase